MGFVCVAGLHRFYLGKVGSGILYLFTLGFFFIGTFADLFSIGTMVDVANTQKKLNQIVDMSVATAANNMAASSARQNN